MSGNGKLDSLQFKIKGKLSVIIRNIGQGNWNEINLDAETKVVFDAGASMCASRREIRNNDIEIEQLNIQMIDPD